MSRYTRKSDIVSIYDCIELASIYMLPLEDTHVYIHSDSSIKETLVLTYNNLSVTRTFDKNTGKILDESVSVTYDESSKEERYEGC